MIFYFSMNPEEMQECASEEKWGLCQIITGAYRIKSNILKEFAGRNPGKNLL